VRRQDSGPAAALVAAWFGLRAEDRGAAAVALHALRGRAARIVAARCRCGIAIAEDPVADAVFIMVYGIRRAPRLRITTTTILAYLCGVARNEWRWDRWRRARAVQVTVARGGGEHIGLRHRHLSPHRVPR
jgi:DNA-directed RNA polymerase specialized sigma24 family protein